MGFYRKIKYFLVHTLMLTNKQAQELIDSGSVEIEGIPIFENGTITDYSEIKVNGKIVRPAKKFDYFMFYKPAGYQSSLNKNVENNISDFFKDYNDLAIAGRLDKYSEGLLLLSNDGTWVENLCNPKFEKEKEYFVTLDKVPNAEFFSDFTKGVKIGSYVTKQCVCEIVNGTVVRVILTEGKNRQIRRMCKNLGYSVVNLKRVRIDSFLLEGLEPGEIQAFNPAI
jgi:23S rRNA pseudouridine2604 synthase